MFIKWLKNIFHVHEWEDIDNYTANAYMDENDKIPYSKRVVYIQKCRTCGKIRSFKIDITA